MARSCPKAPRDGLGGADNRRMSETAPTDLPAVVGQAVLYAAIVVTVATLDFGSRDA